MRIEINFTGLVIFLLVNLGLVQSVSADEEAQVYSPKSSIANHGDAGNVSRTHLKVLIPPGGYARLNAEIATSPMAGPPSTAAEYWV
jgi:hypothetical protein